jgi:hypothetical protein
VAHRRAHALASLAVSQGGDLIVIVIIDIVVIAILIVATTNIAANKLMLIARQPPQLDSFVVRAREKTVIGGRNAHTAHTRIVRVQSIKRFTLRNIPQPNFASKVATQSQIHFIRLKKNNNKVNIF